MTYLIRGKNFEIGDRTKEKIEAVINGIEKLLPADAFINVAVNRGKLTYKTDITLKSGKLNSPFRKRGRRHDGIC